MTKQISLYSFHPVSLHLKIANQRKLLPAFLTWELVCFDRSFIYCFRTSLRLIAITYQNSVHCVEAPQRRYLFDFCISVDFFSAPN